MTTVTVPVQMGPDDLRHLVIYTSPWNRYSLDAAGPDHLLEDLERPGRRPLLDHRWTRAYWVGPHWTAVILVRSYLAQLGHRCAVLWDDATDPAAGYLILTTHNPDPTQATGRARTISTVSPTNRQAAQ